MDSIRYLHDILDWVLSDQFSEQDYRGMPLDKDGKKSSDPITLTPLKLGEDNVHVLRNILTGTMYERWGKYFRWTRHT
jgi:hypothetical protein